MFKRFSIAAVLLILLAVVPTSMVAEKTPPPQAKKAAAEQHPHIVAAIQELKDARHELQTAAHDFGGHRVDAISAVDNAVKQLQLALQYDKQ